MYSSTRGNQERVDAGRAIIEGLAGDGGLFVCEQLPKITFSAIAQLATMNYQERAEIILKEFLTDYSVAQLQDSINQAYGSGFDCNEIAPVKKLDENNYII